MYEFFRKQLNELQELWIIVQSNYSGKQWRMQVPMAAKEMDASQKEEEKHGYNGYIRETRSYKTT